MNSGKFLIVGNDKKMKACLKRIIDKGYEADLYENNGLDFIKEYDYIILPLPTIANFKINGTDMSFSEFSAAVNCHQKVFCGNISTSEYQNFYSYYFNDLFLLKNSRLTAQGVLRLIAENTEDDFIKISVAVIGYGRCGKSICRLLKNCGLKVSSFSRREESVAYAEDTGIDAFIFESFKKHISDFDIIVNTVPVNILSNEEISQLTHDNIYIEVASKPYGFDISQADVFNFRYILAESLPGRFVPVSAGFNIADTVLSILKEEEYG